MSLQGSVCCEGCDNNGGLRQDVNLVAGEDYVLSLDVLLDEYDLLRISLARTEFEIAGTEVAAYKWTRLQFHFRCPPGVEAIDLQSVAPVTDQPACLEADHASIDNIRIDLVNPCPGDFDGDGVITGADLGAWLLYAGDTCEPGEPCPGDLDGDGDGEVRGSDLGVLLANWGLCP